VTIARRSDGLNRLPSRDLEAGRQAHVPFPRPGKGLVEVVDVEHELPLGRREHAEVRQVRVAAELNGDPRRRGWSEIGRHDQRRAPEKRERRGQHSPVSDRNELGDPVLPLLL
jgi:hypothetical protein